MPPQPQKPVHPTEPHRDYPGQPLEIHSIRVLAKNGPELYCVGEARRGPAHVSYRCCIAHPLAPGGEQLSLPLGELVARLAGLLVKWLLGENLLRELALVAGFRLRKRHPLRNLCSSRVGFYCRKYRLRRR